MRYIGDVHGIREDYYRALDGCEQSIQVGDLGYFRENDWCRELPFGHRFIRGNHDNPRLCLEHPNHLQSGPLGDHFLVGGGWSIDRYERTPEVDWWEDEQHSFVDLWELAELYRASTPRVVVTHEAPPEATLRLFPWSAEPGPSRTAQALQSMFESWKPEVWIFGHWHERKELELKGTTFICLGSRGDYVEL